MGYKNYDEFYKGESHRPFEFNKKFLITRNGQPYLYRHTLFSFGKWFSVKIHRIVASDGDCDHDHPWPFVTVILAGGYFEWTPESQKDKGFPLERELGVDGTPELKRWHGTGSIMYRPATHRHRLVLSGGRPATTLVFSGLVMKRWGFFTKLGWVHWKEYVEHLHC